MNATGLQTKLGGASPWIDSLAQHPSEAEAVDEIYLRLYSRLPEKEERHIALAYLAPPAPPAPEAPEASDEATETAPGTEVEGGAESAAAVEENASETAEEAKAAEEAAPEPEPEDPALRRQRFEDLVWSLFNTAEFILNH